MNITEKQSQIIDYITKKLVTAYGFKSFEEYVDSLEFANERSKKLFIRTEEKEFNANKQAMFTLPFHENSIKSLEKKGMIERINIDGVSYFKLI